MSNRYKFDVFGKPMMVERKNNTWRLYLNSGLGLYTQIFDVVIPAELEPQQLAIYLDDIFHEQATDKHPKVIALDASPAADIHQASHKDSLVCSSKRLLLCNAAIMVNNSQLEKQLLAAITNILSPSVVEALPPYFQQINSHLAAKAWLEKMLSESELLVVSLASNVEPIGFIFIHKTQVSTAHIGYLLSETYWHQGLATEMLSALLEHYHSLLEIKQFVAGVEPSNLASIALLQKLGFQAQHSPTNSTQYFHYDIFQQAVADNE